MSGDSGLVICCHCHKHEQLYHVNPDGSRGAAVGPEALYVDPYRCSDLTWERIGAGTIDVIWGENCPVYSQLTHGLRLMKKGKILNIKNGRHNDGTSSALFSILRESHRILKPGGKVLFGDWGKITQEIRKKVEQIAGDSIISESWNVQLINANESPVHLAQISRSVINPKDYLYVFTKKTAFVGGSKVSMRQKRVGRVRKTRTGLHRS